MEKDIKEIKAMLILVIGYLIAKEIFTFVVH